MVSLLQCICLSLVWQRVLNAVSPVFSLELFFWVGAFLLGAAVGSFLNVVAYRLPKILYDEEYKNISCFLIDESKKSDRFLSGISFLDKLFKRFDVEVLLEKKSVLPAKGFLYLAVPGSSCPNCNHNIKFYENIPIFGWLFLRGRCSSCDLPISIQYPIIELITAILTMLVVCFFGITFEALCVFLFIWVLISLTLIDLKYYILPDCLTLPMIWLGLIVSYFGVISLDFHASFLGVIGGYLSLWLINKLSLLFFKKDGIGAGDFKLLAMLGAWQGVGSLFNIILISSVVGAIVGVFMLLNRKEEHNYIPYGPFLALASIVVLMFDLKPESLFGFI